MRNANLGDVILRCRKCVDNFTVKGVVNMDKDYYIQKISEASSRYGDKLLDLMDRYGVSNLMQISTQEAREFWEELSGDVENHKEL